MLIVMPPLSSSQRGHAAIRRSSIDPIDIEMRIAAITVLQKQDEVDDKSHAPTYGTRGSPTGTSYTGRVVPHFPGEDFPQPLTALTTMETQSIYAVEDYSAGHGSHCGTTQASIYTLTAGAPPAREAHLMQLHAMRHYPLIDQYYFSQQECYLNKTLLKWEFDVLKLEESSAQGVLKDVGLKLFDIYGLVDEFELSLVALHQTFQLIQASYHNNPYHNAAHAADVVQAACCLVAEQKISKHMTKLEHLAMIIAGACHDLDHPGVNQAFLKTTNHYLTEAAKRYPKSSNEEQQSPLQQTKSTTNTTTPVAATADESNVMSVLEIHHIRHAAAIFEQTRVFAHFSHEKYLELLRLIKELILATDMAYQGRYMEKLKRLNKEYASLESEEERDRFFRDEDTRRFYLQISLKCADICNTCRPWEVSQKWSRRVTEEFFNQGDMERNLELPINEINDRHRTTIEKVQVGFLKFVARPLFAEWDSIHRSDLSQSLLRYIDDNLVNWSKVQQQTEKLQSAKLSVASNTTTTTVEHRAQATSVDTKSTSTVQQVPPSHQAAISTPPHLPPMQSTESLYESRQFKPHPPDGITELGVIGETPGDEQIPDDDDGLPPADIQQKTRRPSVPCAFVSLDLSVAIIKDNLRQQAAEDSRGADGAYDNRGLNVTADKLDQAEKKKNQVTALVEALSERDSSTTLPAAAGIEGQPGVDDSAMAVFASVPPQNTVTTTNLGLDDVRDTADSNRELIGEEGEGLDSYSRREALQHIDSSATIELLFGDREVNRSPTFSVYSQFKPKPNSEILESMPSEADSEQTQQQIQQYLTPTDYEADLLSRLKYQPFNPEIVAEIQRLSPNQKRRIDELTRQENPAKSSSKPQNLQLQQKQHQQPVQGETSSMKVHKSSNVVASESERKTATSSEKTEVVSESKEATVENKDLNSYAKLTSPPPYRKSIMLTVDKGLEKLRSDYAAKTSASGSGKKFGLRSAKQSLTPQGATQECLKATQATVYEAATLTSQKQTRTLPATIPFFSSTSAKVSAPAAATAPALSSTDGAGGSRPPRRTTSARSENLLPSSTDYSPILSSESLTPGYSSTSSMTSPEMPRRKINQSRSKFFQSLLPASLHHLKASSPEHLNHHHRRLQPDHQQPHHPRHHSSTNVTSSETPSPCSPRQGADPSEGESTTVYSSSSFLTTSTIPHSPNTSYSSTSGIEGDSSHRLGDEGTSGDGTGSTTKSRKIMFRLPSFPALDQELQALSASATASPEESSESPCNITADGVYTSTGQTYSIHIDSEDPEPVPNQGRRPSRTLVQDPVATRTAKRSQSASARLAKTFQKFFGGGTTSKPSGGRSPREKAPERNKAPVVGGSARENTVDNGAYDGTGSSNLLSSSTSASGSTGTTRSPSSTSTITEQAGQTGTTTSSSPSSRTTAPISEDNEQAAHPPTTSSNKKT